MMAIRIAVVIVALGTIAHADGVDDLVTRGEDAARRGDLSVAIDAFKHADAQRPLAKHACLIGLAYTRRELWPQAELFFARCRKRATPSDPIPDWLGAAEQQLADKLAATHTVAVAFAITPAAATALISVSSFAPDETFDTQTIHLTPGAYTIQITADGYLPQRRELVIPADATTSQLIVVGLAREPSRIPPDPETSSLPRNLAIAGIGVLVLGAVLDVFVVGPARDKLDAPLTVDQETIDRDAYALRRDIVVGCYVTGGLALATGLVLRATVLKRSTVAVAASIAPDHVVVGVTWAR